MKLNAISLLFFNVYFLRCSPCLICSSGFYFQFLHLLFCSCITGTLHCFPYPIKHYVNLFSSFAVHFKHRFSACASEYTSNTVDRAGQYMSACYSIAGQAGAGDERVQHSIKAFPSACRFCFCVGIRVRHLEPCLKETVCA